MSLRTAAVTGTTILALIGTAMAGTVAERGTVDRGGPDGAGRQGAGTLIRKAGGGKPGFGIEVRIETRTMPIAGSGPQV